MSTYILYVDGKATEHTVEGKSPAKALVQLVSMADMLLHSQDGRYGKAFKRTDRGGWSFSTYPVMALTQQWSRRRLDPLERTTRL